MKLSSSLKGFITGVVMIATGIALYQSNVAQGTFLQYATYFIYGLGVVWSIYSFAKQEKHKTNLANGTFSEAEQSTNTKSIFTQLFNQGFKCFIVVTLLMALFTFVFYKVNHSVIEEKAALTRTQLLQNEKNRTTKEIDEMIENGKKNYPLMAASMTIFENLFIGMVVTVVTAGGIHLSNKK